MAKTAKKHDVTSNFITVNPPRILAPTSPDYFHNFQRISLHVMGMARDDLLSGLTNKRKLIKPRHKSTPCWCAAFPSAVLHNSHSCAPTIAMGHQPTARDRILVISAPQSPLIFDNERFFQPRTMSCFLASSALTHFLLFLSSNLFPRCGTDHRAYHWGERWVRTVPCFCLARRRTNPLPRHIVFSLCTTLILAHIFTILVFLFF